MRKPGLWFSVITLLSLAAILYTRLVPFDFVWAGRVPWERVTLAPLTMRDVPLNVLLFMPLGFGLAALDGRRTTDDRPQPAGSRRLWSVVRGPLVASLLLSAALEAVQMYMPERVPSLADVIANGLGALAGVGLYRAWAMGFGRALDRYATRRNLLAGLGVYALGAALLTVYLYRSVRLDNWDTSYPLVVGNEAVGKRQWSGKVHRLSFGVYCDSDPVTQASYDFAGQAPYPNITKGFRYPSLDWSEDPASIQEGQWVLVGPGEWLTTTEPFRDFSEQARRCNNFWITTLVETTDPTQRGPARIISISADAERRNVTLGQEVDALIIRLRTPAGGENGQKPEVLVPGVFNKAGMQWITVNYKAPTLRVSVDGTEYWLSLAPGLAFFPGFATENRYPVVMTGNPHRFDYAYWGLVVGLGVLVFGGLGVGKRMNRTRMNTDYTDGHG